MGAIDRVSQVYSASSLFQISPKKACDAGLMSAISY